MADTARMMRRPISIVPPNEVSCDDLRAVFGS
jgi:hypothetical protein